MEEFWRFREASYFLVALALFAAFSSIAGAETYEFTIDGVPEDPQIASLRGRPDEPAPGDLAKVGNFWIVLGEPGTYAFLRDKGRSSTRLRHRGEGQAVVDEGEKRSQGRNEPAAVDWVFQRAVEMVKALALPGAVFYGLLTASAVWRSA